VQLYKRFNALVSNRFEYGYEHIHETHCVYMMKPCRKQHLHIGFSVVCWLELEVIINLIALNL